MENGKNGVERIAGEWTGERWEGIQRPYTADDVARLRGSIRIEYTLARLGAERLWMLMNERPFVRALGALTGLVGLVGMLRLASGAFSRGMSIFAWVANFDVSPVMRSSNRAPTQISRSH